METKDIIKIIKTKDNWDSKELIKVITDEEKSQIQIKFYHIGGYELLTDGTQCEICKSLKEVQDLLKNHDIKYNKSIEDPRKLVNSIRNKWSDIWDDGGGSGWIEG